MLVINYGLTIKRVDITVITVMPCWYDKSRLDYHTSGTVMTVILVCQ